MSTQIDTKFSAIVEVTGGKIRPSRPNLRVVRMKGLEWSREDEYKTKSAAQHESSTADDRNLTVTVLHIGPRSEMQAKFEAMSAERKANRQN